MKISVINQMRQKDVAKAKNPSQYPDNPKENKRKSAVGGNGD